MSSTTISHRTLSSTATVLVALGAEVDLVQDMYNGVKAMIQAEKRL